MHSQVCSPNVRALVNKPMWLEADVQEGDPNVLTARITRLLKPDSAMFQPVVEELTDVCYDVVECYRGPDKGMVFGESRTVELDLYHDCPEWEHSCPRMRDHPADGLGLGW